MIVLHMTNSNLHYGGVFDDFGDADAAVDGEDSSDTAGTWLSPIAVNKLNCWAMVAWIFKSWHFFHLIAQSH